MWQKKLTEIPRCKYGVLVFKRIEKTISCKLFLIQNVYTHKHVFMSMYAFTYIQGGVYSHIYIYATIHICIYMNMHTYICTSLSVATHSRGFSPI